MNERINDYTSAPGSLNGRAITFLYTKLCLVKRFLF